MWMAVSRVWLPMMRTSLKPLNSAVNACSMVFLCDFRFSTSEPEGCSHSRYCWMPSLTDLAIASPACVRVVAAPQNHSALGSGGRPHTPPLAAILDEGSDINRKRERCRDDGRTRRQDRCARNLLLNDRGD